MRDSLERLYQDLDADIARRGWTCRACGACCEFERSGQILFCTSIEADYLADGGDVPDDVSDQTLPVPRRREVHSPRPADDLLPDLLLPDGRNRGDGVADGGISEAPEATARYEPGGVEVCAAGRAPEWT